MADRGRASPEEFDMGRYLGPKEKIERRLGVKLFLKGERSYGPKAAMVRKPYPPGIHGQRRRRKKSEFGLQLASKQKLRFTYGLMEKQFAKYVEKSLKEKKETGNALVKLLESRLDNVVFRLGLAKSRAQARQLVSHGHLLINGGSVNIPSYQTKKGDKIELKERSVNNSYFNKIKEEIKKHVPPSWLKLDVQTLGGEVVGAPVLEESGIEHQDIYTTIEFYSR